MDLSGRLVKLGLSTAQACSVDSDRQCPALTVDLIMNSNIPDAIVVMTTVENEEQAVRIARQLASSSNRTLPPVCRSCPG